MRSKETLDNLDRCKHDADMVLLRALYLSWLKASRETPAQRASGIITHEDAAS